MTKTLILIVLDVAMSVAGQLLLKKGMQSVGAIDTAFFSQPLLGLWRMFTTSPLVLVTPDISPFVLSAKQLIVPVGGFMARSKA